jgi:succinate dehydrogenase / fumarate reductase membrane anchor subunit
MSAPVRTIYRSNPSRAARPMPEEPGRERFWWWYMRISGLLLVLMALGHMFIMHILVQIRGEEISFEFVAGRWGTPFWRIYDAVLLLLAMTHGVNGARIVIGDYVRERTARRLLILLLGAIAVVWIVLGLLVVIFFNPDTAPPVGPFS